MRKSSSKQEGERKERKEVELREIEGLKMIGKPWKEKGKKCPYLIKEKRKDAFIIERRGLFNKREILVLVNLLERVKNKLIVYDSSP